MKTITKSWSLLLLLANIGVAQDIANINSTYEIKIVLDESGLNEDANFQRLLAQGMDRRNCIKVVKNAALNAVRNNLVSQGVFWSVFSEDTVLAKLTEVHLAEMSSIFSEDFVKLEISTSNLELEDTSEKLKLARELQTPPFKRFVGLSFKEAEKLVRQDYVESNGNRYIAKCRIKSIDSELLEMDCSEAGCYLLFDIEGGQIIHVESLERK